MLILTETNQLILRDILSATTRNSPLGTTKLIQGCLQELEVILAQCLKAKGKDSSKLTISTTIMSSSL